MSRLPFDPARMAAARQEQREAKPAAASLSVSQLAAMIDRCLREGVPAGVRVVGEIGQLSEKTHWYFTLKDAESSVSCVMWAAGARRLGFTPAQGQQVVATGRVEFYAKQGRTTFLVEKLEPIGAGALDLAFKQLCAELRGLGWFDEERKRALPLLPRRVAVVTSRQGAALQDVLDTARRRCPAVPLALVDVRVQGDGAAAQIALAVRRLGALRRELGIDAILITRGGGSMEDLWAFNDRALAETILRSPVPVVAAIGHETDTTIAELVADLRCATPTQAAMRILPDADELRQQLRSLGARLASLTRRHVRTDGDRVRGARKRLALVLRERGHADRARVDRLAARLERHRPGAEYARREAALRHAEARLRAAAAARIRCADAGALRKRLESAWKTFRDRQDARLYGAMRSLDLVGPQSVLNRGYSMTVRADGTVIRSVAEVREGDAIRTRLADGAFDSVVGDGAVPAPVVPAPPVLGQRPVRRKPSRAPRGRDQLDLFGKGG